MTGLEALKELKPWKETNNENGVVWLPLFVVEDIEKSLKALEIIKNKTVDIWLIQNKKTLKEYNSMVDYSRKLTEEEFNILKEVLE